MNNELYSKLVDLYAGNELPAELEDQMELAAAGNAGLNHDMTTLRRVVDALHNLEDPEYTEESYHRILMKLYSRGVDIQPREPVSSHFQYNLPLQG
ncbi:MAG TPA: hypothetical protein VJ835_05050 [Fimbriimonadaceae bacterium]|nr:hypothetical protein [Fimbriimonadaceae bacterium]